MPILKEIIDNKRFLNLTDDDLTQITNELQQNPLKAFGLEPNVSFWHLRLLINPYLDSFNPDHYSAASGEQKYKISQAAKLISTTHTNLVNERFIEAVFRNDENQIEAGWENYNDELNEISLIAYGCYAKTIGNAKFRALLSNEFTKRLNPHNFAKNKNDLIGKVLKNLDKYDQPYIKSYLELLPAKQEEKYRLVGIAILKQYFNEEVLKILLGWRYLVQETDWVFVVAQAIKEDNDQALTIIINKCKDIGIIGKKAEDLDNFLSKVVEVQKSEFAGYSNQQRSIILKFFAKHNNPHFSMLLYKFGILPTEDILQIMQNCLGSEHGKTIEEKFEWHATFEIRDEHRLPTGNTILHFFASLSPSELPIEYTEYLSQILNAYKEHINKKNKLGEAPLNIACQVIKGSSELVVVKTLLKLNADPNIFDQAENSPLIIAVKNTNIKLFKLLVLNGADPNLTNKHKKNIHFYISECENKELRDEMFKFLLDLAEKNKSFSGTTNWLANYQSCLAILKTTMQNVIAGGNQGYFVSMLSRYYKVWEKNLHVINEILPMIINLRKTAMLSAVFEKFPRVLEKDSDRAKELFCNTVKKNNPGMVSVLLGYVTKEYCQQNDVQKLITEQENEQLTDLIAEYISSKPAEPIDWQLTCQKRSQEETETPPQKRAKLSEDEATDEDTDENAGEKQGEIWRPFML